MTRIIIPTSAPYAGLLAALHGRGFAKPWSEADFANLCALPNVSGWIAVDEVLLAEAALPVGFVLTRLAADEAEILTLTVLPAFRRQGVARALVSYAAAGLYGAGGRQLFLEVATGNESAIALYAGLGFSEVGRRLNYYDPGVALSRDALTLRAPLPLPTPG